MAGRWTDDRREDWRDRDQRAGSGRERDWREQRDWRERDWRDREGRRTEAYRGEEARSWSGRTDPDADAYEQTGRRRPGYGAGSHDYGEHDYGDRDYGARSGVTTGGGAYGAESYGRGRSWSASGQERYGPPAPRFTTQDYTGRGHDRPEERRETWERDRDRAEAERRRAMSDDGREPGREGAGDFLHRAGERIGSWFRGDDLMRGSREDRGYRGHGPKGYQRSDERISDEVHHHLTDDPWLDASHIQVEVKGGEVTLSGHIDNREAKHRAERLIEDLSGVRHVQNNLRVEPSLFTDAGRGYGSSALDAQMRRNTEAIRPGGDGSGAATEASVDPKTGGKRN